MRKIVSLILISIFVLIYSCSEDKANFPSDYQFEQKDWTEYFPLKKGAYWIYAGWHGSDYDEKDSPDFYDTMIVEKKINIKGHVAYFLKRNGGWENDTYFYFDGPYLYELRPKKYEDAYGSIWMMVADFILKQESKPKVFNWKENQGDANSNNYSKLLITNTLQKDSDSTKNIMDSIYTVTRFTNTLLIDFTQKSGTDNLDGYKHEQIINSYYIKNIGLAFSIKKYTYTDLKGQKVIIYRYLKLIKYYIPE